MGVRDEVGFLTIHQGYADFFFPGTSVLHTRARYALFVPWLFEDLAGLTGSAAQRALRERERQIAGRLKAANEKQVIGSRVYPKPSSQPPSTVYWNALHVWGIVRPRANGRTMSRAQAHRLLKAAGHATDDDGQPLLGFEPPFVRLPDRPTEWRSGDIHLRLAQAEAAFLRDRLGQLRRNRDGELSLLARLVRAEAAAPTEMWADEVRLLAGPDEEPLARALQAASLAGIGRAVYDALVEQMLEVSDAKDVSTRHRTHLHEMIGLHGPIAVQLDVAALERDIGALPTRLRDVIVATIAWIASGSADPGPLLEVYSAAEARKGSRARLVSTPNGRSRRLEWSIDQHGFAEPLHYRWGQVTTLLDDLANIR